MALFATTAWRKYQMTIPAPMPQLPRPGQFVYWRNNRHAHALGWVDAYGPGPFIVVDTVDNSHLDVPASLILRTQLGDRPVNQVWLAVTPEPGESAELAGNWEGYNPDLLLTLDA